MKSKNEDVGEEEAYLAFAVMVVGLKRSRRRADPFVLMDGQHRTHGMADLLSALQNRNETKQ